MAASIITQTFTATGTSLEDIEVGEVGLQSVQIVDQGSFSGSVDIQVSNNGEDWVTASNGSALAAGVLVNIDEDARYMRASATVSAGTVDVVFCLLG